MPFKSSVPQQTRTEVLPVTKTTQLTRAIDSFLLDCEARSLSPRSVEFYDGNLKPFVAWLEEQNVTTLEAITASHCRAYLVALQQRELSAYSQHAAARSIRAWLNFCVADELLAASPMRKVKMPKLPKEILPAFTPADVKKILDACLTARDRAIVLCLLDSGCRASEFMALNVGDVEVKTGTVKVRLGKGAKDRVCLLGTMAGRALDKYMRSRLDATPDEPLWVNAKTGERLTKWGLRELLERLGKKSGVEDCHAHTFR